MWGLGYRVAPRPDYELKTLAADWFWLIQLEDYELISVSPFGDLFLRDESDAYCLLDINLGCLEYATKEGIDPAELFPIAFDDSIARGYRESGLLLKPGTCYGYKTPCVTGGSVESNNVYVADLPEYVSFMGCFHFQIKDVVDGETVEIKGIRPKLN